MNDPVGTIERLLPEYLGRQRWFAGDAPKEVRIVDQQEIEEGFRWMIVDAEGARYQVLVGFRPAYEPPEFLHGSEGAVLGTVGGTLAFDAVLDARLARSLLNRVAPGETADHVRPIGVEQSHTSLIFDDRLLLKIFRRLHEGPNPEIEITEKLAAAGFAHVAAPLATWTFDDSHLAVVQPYLVGGAEGWALALTSLRDLYSAECDDPAECGGDFAGEAWRLGEVTAAMHLAMAEVFGSKEGDPAAWASMTEAQLARLEEGDADRARAEEFVDRLRVVENPGSAIRIHGDYHLGQVLRTDTGWFVLDFEGEPARPPEERQLFSSPLQDVAGMMRSFQYAAAVALAERGEAEHDELVPLAAAWEGRNRRSFLEGYLRTDGVDALLPNVDDRPTVLTAFELDKAIYEVLYERSYRPDWVGIPRAAIAALLEPDDESSQRGPLSLG
ncbi:MAG TPA: phosphotransferase [Acidimicrobiales bacterium]|nr:phosphotransferase [Acidimicrobiales bacterium]